MNGLNVMITVAQILEAVVGPALHHHGAEQSRPQPGDVGGAHPAWRRQDRVDAGIPDLPYHKYAELLGLKGIFVDRSGAARRGMGGGAARRPAGDPRSLGGPERAAAAAAHHAEGREELHDDDGATSRNSAASSRTAQNRSLLAFCRAGIDWRHRLCGRCQRASSAAG